MGAKNAHFVEVRMFFLDRFLKDIALLPYLYESAEFQMFVRPLGDLEKAIKALGNQNTDDILHRFRVIMPVNERAGDLKLKAYNEVISEFVKDCKDLIAYLKAFKK